MCQQICQRFNTVPKNTRRGPHPADKEVVTVTHPASDTPSINQSAIIGRAGSTVCRDVDISQEIMGPVAEQSSRGHCFSSPIQVSQQLRGWSGWTTKQRVRKKIISLKLKDKFLRFYVNVHVSGIFRHYLFEGYLPFLLYCPNWAIWIQKLYFIVCLWAKLNIEFCTLIWLSTLVSAEAEICCFSYRLNRSRDNCWSWGMLSMSVKSIIGRKYNYI